MRGLSENHMDPYYLCWGPNCSGDLFSLGQSVLLGRSGLDGSGLVGFRVQIL